VDAGGDAYNAARDFVINGEALGIVLPKSAEVLASTGRFTVSDEAVSLDAADEAAATAVLRDVFDALRASDSVPMLRGWCDEPVRHKADVAQPAR
jgi:hypothetical protein